MIDGDMISYNKCIAIVLIEKLLTVTVSNDFMREIARKQTH